MFRNWPENKSNWEVASTRFGETLTSFVEEFSWIAAWMSDFDRDRTHQFDNMCNVIFISTVIFSAVRFEEVVSRS